MDKQPLPPSYQDIYPSATPSAPLMQENVPPQGPQPTALGWNQQMHPQYSHSPVLSQPVNQPQMIQHQIPQQQTIVIINQQIHLGENPVNMMCPHCKQQTVTRIDYETSWVTHVCAGVLCLMGWCPCAIIPYCTTCLKDVTHKCSKCHGYIGIFRRSDGGASRRI